MTKMKLKSSSKTDGWEKNNSFYIFYCCPVTRGRAEADREQGQGEGEQEPRDDGQEDGARDSKRLVRYIDG